MSSLQVLEQDAAVGIDLADDLAILKSISNQDSITELDIYIAEMCLQNIKAQTWVSRTNLENPVSRRKLSETEKEAWKMIHDKNLTNEKEAETLLADIKGKHPQS